MSETLSFFAIPISFLLYAFPTFASAATPGPNCFLS